VDRRGQLRRLLVGFLALLLAVPSPLWASSALGVVRGQKAARLTLDGGKSWLTLGGRSLPVLGGSELRTTGGSATLEMTDGSRAVLLPFGAARFRDDRGAIEISLLHGRLTFQIPGDSRLEITTPSARLVPVDRQPKAGEVVVSGAGQMGLKMLKGTVQVSPLAAASRPMLASLEPVFLPSRPDMSGPFFTSDPLPPPPAGAKGVFAPGGESIGYLGQDGRLIAHPGFTSDLTRPFPGKLVQLAASSIADEHKKSDAMPLFDVNGANVGYVAGSVFYAQSIQTTPPSTQGEQPRRDSGGGGFPLWAWGAIGAVVLIGGGLALAGGGGGGGGGGDEAPVNCNVATAVRPPSCPQ
jgi:FecR protein